MLNQKDKKILAILDMDARLSNSKIAKKIGLSKQVVDYRIKNLLKKGIIKGFITVIDTSVLGYNVYKLFLQLEKTTQEKEKDILQYFKKHPSVAWVVTSSGKWEIILVVFAKSVQEFSKILVEISEYCGKQVQDYEVLTVVSAYPLGHKYIFKQELSEKIGVFEIQKEVKLDKKDLIILEVLDRSGRLPIVDIIKKTGISFDTISFRIKRLQRSKVIRSFKPIIDVYKLDLQWYLVLFRLHSLSREKLDRFISFAKQHKNISYLNLYVGNWDLSIEIHAESALEFRNIMIEIKNLFSDIIRNYESIIIFNEYKYTFFPDIIKKQLKEK